MWRDQSRPTSVTLPPPAEGPSVGAATNGTQETQPSLMAKQALPALTLHNTGAGLCCILPVVQNEAQIQKAKLLHDAKPSDAPNIPATDSCPGVPVLQNCTLTQSGLQLNQITTSHLLDYADASSPPMQETAMNLLINQIIPSHPVVLDHKHSQEQPTAPGGIPMQQSPSMSTVSLESSLYGEVPSQASSQAILMDPGNQQVGAGSIQGPPWSFISSEYVCPHHGASVATNGSAVSSSQIRRAIRKWLLAQHEKREAFTQSTASFQTPVLSVADLPTETPKPCQMTLKGHASAMGHSLDHGDSGSVSKDNLKSMPYIWRQQLQAAKTSQSITTGGHILPETRPTITIHHHPASHGSDHCVPQSLQSSRGQSTPTCRGHSLAGSQGLLPSRRQSTPTCRGHSNTASQGLSPSRRQSTLPPRGPSNTASQSLSPSRRQSTPTCRGHSNTASQGLSPSRSPPYFQYDSSLLGLICAQGDTSQAKEPQFLLQAETGDQIMPGSEPGALGPDQWTALGRGSTSAMMPESTSTPSNQTSLYHCANSPDLPSAMIPQQPGTSSEPNHHGSNHISKLQGPRQSLDYQESSLTSDMESSQFVGHNNEHKLSSKESSSPSCDQQPNEILDKNKQPKTLNHVNLLSYSEQGSVVFPKHQPEQDQKSSSTHARTEEVTATTCQKS